MTSKYLDHEWALSIGFNNGDERNDFLRSLKASIRDSLYSQVLLSFHQILEIATKKRDSF